MRKTCYLSQTIGKSDPTDPPPAPVAPSHPELGDPLPLSVELPTRQPQVSVAPVQRCCYLTKAAVDNP